jgi:hypothetical protein
MGRSDLLAWILVGVGAFSICGAVFDWEWFMNNRKARLWVKLFGRKGARVFYVIFGGALAVGGMLMITGLIGRPK